MLHVRSFSFQHGIADYVLFDSYMFQRSVAVYNMFVDFCSDTALLSDGALPSFFLRSFLRSFVVGLAAGAVGASSPPGAGVPDRHCPGHGEDLACGGDEQGLCDVVGPSFPGEKINSCYRCGVR